MYKPLLFAFQAAVLLSVSVIHIAALRWYLYWYYPWLDILTHFLGGLWVALASAWCIAYLGRKPGFLQLIGVVMLIGVGWEIFEVVGGIVSVHESNYPLDTSLDLLMDFTGGVFGYLSSRFLADKNAMGVSEAMPDADTPRGTIR